MYDVSRNEGGSVRLYFHRQIFMVIHSLQLSSFTDISYSNYGMLHRSRFESNLY